MTRTPESITTAGPETVDHTAPPASRSARRVAAGILLSRISGLIRERVFAHFFGNTLYADAFRAALRMPNVLQNLLGEGTLSASFIPVYAELLEQGREEDAGRVAGAIFALLLAIAGGLALMGILLAPALVSVFSPGFHGERRALTISAVRIIFPMTGVLVLSAWALGVLNSHRKFFLSYVAPVLWNAAMITALLVFGTRQSQAHLLVTLAWAALVGGLLQFGAQLPGVLMLERQLQVRWNTRLKEVRIAMRNAVPAILGRGVVQFSGWIDVILASFLAAGGVSGLSYAMTLYGLPIGLFGMSVAAAELPELSRQRTSGAEVLQRRVNRGLRQIAVFVVPSMVGYLLLGDVVVGTLYQTGAFDHGQTLYVAAVLGGFAVGLLATTTTRLFSSAFFALHDTATPAKVAAVRVTLSGLAGGALMLWLRNYQIAGNPLGPVGLSLAAGLAAWVEWLILRHRLRARIGPVGAGLSVLARMFGAAVAAALLGRLILLALPTVHPVLAGVICLLPYGIGYFLIARMLGVEEARQVLGRIGRRLSR